MSDITLSYVLSWSALLTITPALAAAGTAPDRLFQIHKHIERCDTIAPFDHALQTEDFQYFEGWTESDFDEAMRWAGACPRSSYKLGPSDRLQDLAWMRARRPDTKSTASAQQNDCKQSSAYALFHAQEAVIDDREGIAAAKATIARERHVGEISGAVNLEVQHTAGNQILEWTEDLKNDFHEYKSLGGSAPTPATVTHRLKDPCATD